MNDKQNIACNILDYWFTMEFLSQDSYESCTEANWTIVKKVDRESKTIFSEIGR